MNNLLSVYFLTLNRQREFLLQTINKDEQFTLRLFFKLLKGIKSSYIQNLVFIILLFAFFTIYY
jgi:hypothetical protein